MNIPVHETSHDHFNEELEVISCHVCESESSTNFFINNLFIPTVLALTYGYMVYQQIYPLGLEENIDFDIILKNFNLYQGLPQLMELMDNELFVLIFWIHF